jgi:hypothetical protein
MTTRVKTAGPAAEFVLLVGSFLSGLGALGSMLNTEGGRQVVAGIACVFLWGVFWTHVYRLHKDAWRFRTRETSHNAEC